MAVLCGLEKLSARNQPLLYLPESTGESGICPWLSSGRNKAGSPAWLDSNGWAGWKRGLHKCQPGQKLVALTKGAEAGARAGWGISGLFKEAEAAFLHLWLWGDVSVSLNQHKNALFQNNMVSSINSRRRLFGQVWTRPCLNMWEKKPETSVLQR